MSDEKFDLEVEADKPTAISRKDQLDAVTFNMDVITARDSELAERIKHLYDEAKSLKPDDKLDGAEEDVALVSEIFKGLQQKERS